MRVSCELTFTALIAEKVRHHSDDSQERASEDGGAKIAGIVQGSFDNADDHEWESLDRSDHWAAMLDGG